MNSLNQNIRQFYDASTGLWEKAWGEHMHHGYYGINGDVKKDHRQAQVDLIEELLRWGNVSTAKYILDVGCGIGGSARYLAKKYNAEVVGTTLSPVQAERAKTLTRASDISQPILFMVEDALTPSFPPASFDLIWSLESAEHIPRKSRLLYNWYTLLKPGGKVLMATWCHRPIPPELTDSEQQFLQRIYSAYHLPPFISLEMYAALMEDVGFSNVETADWSKAVAPFWNAVFKSALKPINWVRILRAGKFTRAGVMTIRRMKQGYRSGLIRFGVVQGVKSE